MVPLNEFKKVWQYDIDYQYIDNDAHPGKIMGEKEMGISELPVKQERFVSEYLVDLNGASAARRAGYSPKAAKEQAHYLLTKTHIQALIQTRCRETEARLELVRDDVIRGLLAAYKEAKQEKNAMAMIAAMREIGKMMGYYSPVRGGRQIERVSRGSGSIGMELKSDRELMAMCRNSKSSTG